MKTYSAGSPAISAVLLCLAAQGSFAASGAEVQARLAADVSKGLPVVVHVVVALCDNENQGIVPVSRELGDGRNPGTNLYWGALYGVRTYLGDAGGWRRLSATARPDDERILERAIFTADIDRGGDTASVYIVADAWDGAYIEDSLAAWLGMAAGNAQETVVFRDGSYQAHLKAAGMAHMVAFVGHNGLMDFHLETPRRETADPPPRSAVVLACESRPYFEWKLRAVKAHTLLLTTGLMAPEAYTLDAAIRAWAAGKAAPDVRQAAAAAYHRYQQCGLRAAERLFRGEP